MGTAFYSLYAIAHAVLAGLAFRQARVKFSWPIGVILVLATTLAFDNVMLVLGNAIGEGDTLLTLSRPRFVIHAFVTPVSIAVAVDQGRRLGVSWATGPRARVATWGLVAVMIGLGVIELAKLELVAETGLGLLHYSSAEATIPIPAIVSVVAVIVVGRAVRRVDGWSLLFTLGIVSFIGSSVPPIDGMLLVGNLVEIAFVAALLFTERHAVSVTDTPATSPELAHRAL